MFNLSSELEIKVSYMTIIHDKMHLCCGKNNLATHLVNLGENYVRHVLVLYPTFFPKNHKTMDILF